MRTTGWSALLRMFMAVRLMCELYRGAFCLNIIVNNYSFVNTIVYLFKCVCVCACVCVSGIKSTQSCCVVPVTREVPGS